MLLLLLSLFLSQSYADTTRCNLVPPNEIHIPKGLGTGVSKKNFKAAISAIHAVYDSVVSGHDAVLTINDLWDDETVNSDTTTSGNGWVINAYGGLARYPGMTADGYLTVLCHELGHHLGGYPKYPEFSALGSSWASNEGESDYFATLKCYKRIHVAMEDYSNDAAQAAGISLASVLASLNGSDAPSPNSRDTSQVSQTYDGHPAAQCRLDTYLAGVACKKSFKTPFSETEPTGGACAEEAGEHIGVRPHCWYKPR